MAFYCYRAVFLAVIFSAVQWSVQIDTTIKPVLFESLSNATEESLGTTICSIGNEACSPTPSSNSDPHSDPATDISSTQVPSTGESIATDSSVTNATTLLTSTTLSNASLSTTPAPFTSNSNVSASTTAVPSTSKPEPAVPSAKPAQPALSVSRKVDQETDLSEDDTCTCDLSVKECENNCCCDPDCEPYQLAVFSSCLPRPRPLFDDRMCHTVKTIVVNNTEKLIEEIRPGALCIVKTNLAAWVGYPTRPVLLSESKFRRTWDRYRAHSPNWPQVENRAHLSSEPAPYIQDAFLWKFHPQHAHTFDLPSASVTSQCSANRPIRFLRSWKNSCLQKSPENELECRQQSVDFFIRKINIVRNPMTVNRTALVLDKVALCPKKLCAPVFSYQCSEEALDERNFSSCINVSTSTVSFYDEKTHMCRGVLTHLSLVIHHNGTKGINSIFAYYSVANVSNLHSTPTAIRRSFSVDFQWANANSSAVVKNQSSAETKMNKRSGHPGYIGGKAVLSGYRHRIQDPAKQSSDSSGKRSENPIVEEKIRLIESGKDGLSLFGPGSCSQRGRYPVLFGEDIHVSCELNVTESNLSSPLNCSQLRINILSLLLGQFNTQQLLNSPSSDAWGVVIGTFGDSNPEEQSDWVPLILDGLPMTPAEFSRPENRSSSESLNPETLKCDGVVTGMELRILYSFVGSINNPQSKIIGASVRFYSVQDLFGNCDSETASYTEECVQRLFLTSSVKFVDMSSPAVARYAEPPGIHIRLPPDFFYPFMVGAASTQNVPRTDLTLCLCVLLFLRLSV